MFKQNSIVYTRWWFDKVYLCIPISVFILTYILILACAYIVTYILISRYLHYVVAYMLISMYL